MEEIAKNYGFLHISEKIFKCLDKEDLINCRLVNKSFKKILDRSEFWINKLDLDKVPAIITTSWKTFWQTYKEWNMLPQEVEKINTRLEDFILLMIKIFKSQRIELTNPLEVAVMLAKAEKYPELSEFICNHADTSGFLDSLIKEHFGDIREIPSGLVDSLIKKKIANVRKTRDINTVIFHHTVTTVGLRIATGVRDPYSLQHVARMYICELQAGGLAESSGLFAVNDEILEVNGIKVAEKSLDNVLDILDIISDALFDNGTNLFITLQKQALTELLFNGKVWIPLGSF